VQADLKTFAALGVYGMAAITAATVQNTRRVRAVHPLPPALVAAQIAAVLDDIPPAAVKIGMLGAADTVGAVANALAESDAPVVLDPVRFASRGGALLSADAVIALHDHLLPRVCVVTPNASEASWLLHGRPPTEWARTTGIAVLITGGDTPGSEVIDRLTLPSGRTRAWRRARIDTRNTHGTGCTLSSAIAAFIAHGADLETAIDRAIGWVEVLLLRSAGHGLGGGTGPLLHALTPPRGAPPGQAPAPTGPPARPAASRSAE